MNKLNIASTGYPGTTESWKHLESEIQELAEAVAGLTISESQTPVVIVGIRQNQMGYTPGYFVWKGEVYYFEGGTPDDYVCIIEDVTDAVYNTDMTNPGQLASLPTYIKRYARFGGANEGVDRFLFGDMERLVPQSSYIIKDEIRMYAGDINNIPTGWYLCDGQNGTVDLRGKFIVGLNASNPDYGEIGVEGGNETLELTVDNLPSHSHTGNTDSSGAHTHHINIPLVNTGDAGGDQLLSPTGNTGHAFSTNSAGDHQHSFTTNPTGDGKGFDNRPQYYTLAFIQFKGL